MNPSDPAAAGKIGPIQRLIAGCANNPILTVITVMAAVAWGYYSLRQVPLDAIPDLSDAQVKISLDRREVGQGTLVDLFSGERFGEIGSGPGVVLDLEPYGFRWFRVE